MGPTGQRIAATIAELRHARRLKKTDVVDRLQECGRRLSLDVLTKIEAGTRAVDADDLVALAVALNVSPLRLMLADPGHDTEQVDLTPEVSASVARAYAWGQGRRHLDDEPDGRPIVRADVPREWVEFALDSHPDRARMLSEQFHPGGQQ